MATKDVTVTVTMDEHDWRLVEDAADCAGMTVQRYIAWNVRLLAEQSRPGAPQAPGHALSRPPRPIPVVEESDDAVWVEAFAERLGHRADLYRED
ncbi:hypothetical protein ACWEKT_39765 [Nocardia takedensis]